MGFYGVAGIHFRRAGFPTTSHTMNNAYLFNFYTISLGLAAVVWYFTDSIVAGILVFIFASAAQTYEREHRSNNP